MATPIGVVIPTDSTGLANYTFTVQLDGSDFILTLQWNVRGGRWHLSLSDQDENAIVTGIRVVANHDLLRRCVDARRPPGILLARVSNGDSDPAFGDFGQRCDLMYYSAADVALVRSLTSPPA